MPLYEYSCSNCSKDFELLLRGRERAVCPNCGSRRVQRLLSLPAVHTAGRSRSLPVCQSSEGPGCDPEMCRSGRCPLD